MDDNAMLDQLIMMSNRMAHPDMDLVILGEGNTSTKLNDQEFCIKASGFQLNGIQAGGFVKCRFDRIIPTLDQPNLNDEQVKETLLGCRCDQSTNLLPSVETFFHSYLLTLPGINFVAHTHATAVNKILCSINWRAMEQPMFPDQIVNCGIAPCMIEFTDPGNALSKKLREKVEEYVHTYGVLPRMILMQNHGIISFGETAKAVEATTSMAVKTARILLGAMQMGGVHAFSHEIAQRIQDRPDEHYRQKLIDGLSRKEK
jgi:rhamnose utilization protein RhaD (predicted bifunctional aldolase and dehydrogenase)